MAKEKEKTEPSDRKRYHHGDLRQALIDGALELISEGNIESLSLRGLARKVGVSYAAPYHHFKDKTQLLAELAIDGFERLGVQMREQCKANPEDPRDALLAQGRAYLQFAVAHPSHYRVMFSIALSGRGEYSEVQDAADACFDHLVADTQMLVGLGVPETEVQKISTVIWSTVHGAATLWNDGLMCSHVDGASFDEFVEIITGPLVDMVVGLADVYKKKS